MEAVLWSVEGKQAENCFERLQLLCHQMDSAGGLIKAVVGAEVGHADRFGLITFWKSWDNVSSYLANAKSDVLPKLGSPHHFEVVWQSAKEEVSTAKTGKYLLAYDIYAENDTEAALEHLRAGAGRLSHVSGFESAAIWIDRNHPGHLLLAAHWSVTQKPYEGRVEACLMLDEDKVRVTDRRVTVYQIKELSPLMRV